MNEQPGEIGTRVEATYSPCCGMLRIGDFTKEPGKMHSGLCRMAHGGPFADLGPTVLLVGHYGGSS